MDYDPVRGRGFRAGVSSGELSVIGQYETNVLDYLDALLLENLN